MFNDDGINPANGLPMMGSVDIEGNPYGTDSSDLFETVDYDDSFESGCDSYTYDSFDSF